MDQYFSTNLEKICQNIPDQNRRVILLEKINSFKLYPEEEKILLMIFPVATTDVEIYLDFFEKRLEEMRGHTPNAHVWLDEKEIKNLDFSDPNFDWEFFSRTLLRSIYIWGNEGDGFDYFVMRLLDKFDTVTNGNFLFADFPEPYGSVCLRSSLILMFRYFSTIKEEWVMYILRSDLLPLSIVMGLDLDKAIREAIEYYNVVDNRLELSRKMASFMLINKFPLGQKQEDGEASLSYWINQFELFSEGKFDGISLVNFFNDQDRWRNTEEIDKMTIKSLIVVFTFLVDGHYILPAKSDTIEMKKTISAANVDNKKYNKIDIKSKFIGINDPTQIITKLQELSEMSNDPKILESYYYDEPTGEFKWKE